MLYKLGYDGSVNAQNSQRPQVRGSSYGLCNINDCSLAGFYHFTALSTAITYPSKFTRVVFRNGFLFTSYLYYTRIEGGVVASCYGLMSRNTYRTEVDGLKALNLSSNSSFLAYNTYWKNCYIHGMGNIGNTSFNNIYENCSISHCFNIMVYVFGSKFTNCYIYNSLYGINNNVRDVEFINCEFGWDEFGNSRDNYTDLGYNFVYCTHINSRVPNSGWGHRDRNSFPLEGRHIMENENGVLGAHVIYDVAGTITKVDADGSGSKPTQRVGGNDTISEIVTLSSAGMEMSFGYSYGKKTVNILEQQIYTQIGVAKTIRYYVQTDYTGGLTNEEVYLAAEYVSSGDATVSKIQSTEAVAIRSNQSDWSQYVEVTINPSQDCWVRLKLEVGAYESGKYIWVDPKPEIIF